MVVSSSKCPDKTHCKAQHTSVRAPSPWSQELPTVHQGQSHLQLSGQGPWATPSSCSSSPLPNTRCSYAKNLTEIFTQSTVKPRDKRSCDKGVGKKDQVFLSEQQLRSCTWSPAAIFNKMLLFNIVYCQQPMVIFSWTMHTQASKSLCLSLKLGRIFQELHNDITSLPHSPFPQLSYLSNNIPWNMFPRAWGHSHLKFSVLVGFLTEEVICTNKSLICTLRNPSIKPTKGQRI